MCPKAFQLRRFLRAAYGTEPFIEYCARRQLAFEQVLGFPMHDEDTQRWQLALASLPEPEQAKVELELAQVQALAHPAALALLVAAAQKQGPPPESVPDGIPLALWCFLHHATLFHDVFLRQEIASAETWRCAMAPPGLLLDDLETRQDALSASLQEFFAGQGGTGRFCAVESYQLAEATCFVAYLSDRLQLLEVFTDEGAHTTHATRPAFPVLFVYHPSDGRLLLKARQRTQERILELFRRFGQTVLQVSLDARCLAPAFCLDLLKRRFDPLPDAPDMEQVRVKALHLAYPERRKRRHLKLETLSGDEPFAILELLHAHGGSDVLLDQLAVIYAELEITLRLDGRSQRHLLRLWPDRCNATQTPLGERFRTCLQRWGIAHAL
jgi:hypothetical protein